MYNQLLYVIFLSSHLFYFITPVQSCILFAYLLKAQMNLYSNDVMHKESIVIHFPIHSGCIILYIYMGISHVNLAIFIYIGWRLFYCLLDSIILY